MALRSYNLSLSVAILGWGTLLSGGDADEGSAFLDSNSFSGSLPEQLF